MREGVQEKSPSKECQSGLGRQQGDGKKWGPHAPGCTLGGLSVGVRWGVPFKGPGAGGGSPV